MAVCAAAAAQDRPFCDETTIGQIVFHRNSTRLTVAARKKLDSLIVFVTDRPDCGIVATGYASDLCSKCGAFSWKRMEAIALYFAKNKTAGDKFRFNIILTGNSDQVDFSLTTYTPLKEAPLHPNLRKNNPPISTQ